MKKWISLTVVAGLLGLYPVPALAQGLQKGDQMVSVFVGAGGATNNTHLPWNFTDDTGLSLGKTQDLGWGDESVAFGAQYLYAISSYWAFGAEYNAHFFGGATDELHAWGGGQHMKATVDQDMDVHNIMFAGRLTLNPRSAWRVYIPLGAGIAWAKSTLKNSFAETGGGVTTDTEDRLSASSRSFTYYVGVGLEHRLAGAWLWGLEGRYQSFRFDYGQFAPGLGGENLHYITAMFKLSYMF